MPRTDDSIVATGLQGILEERIRRDGPMPVDAFMRACLEDPAHGYWQRAHTIGRGGDFITSPEISQVFGELVGLWCAVTWQRMGEPDTVNLVELGPGLGTLMRDVLRAARAVPAFAAAIRVHLVETSPALRTRQAQALAGSGCQPAWHDSVGDVASGPAIVIANEFLDALPIRQLVFDGGWRERVLMLGADGKLQFGVGDAVACALEGTQGAIAEMRPGEEVLLGALAGRLQDFVALLIDYGPAASGLGDTLQAVRDHAYTNVLDSPGAADLTAHVQFAAFGEKARNLGLAADGPLTQAEFLGCLGIAERAAKLMAANPARAGEIEAGVHRLISPTGMGSLFKVMAVRSSNLPPSVPFG